MGWRRNTIKTGRTVRLFVSMFLCMAVTAGSADIKEFNLQGFIDREISAGNREIKIPPGRYRVVPRNGVHLALRGLKDVSISATEVDMICSETVTALSVSECTNLTIRGLSIDYDPLPFTQGKITAITQNGSLFDVELFDGYPAASLLSPERTSVYSHKTRTKITGDINYQQPEMIDAKHVRFRKGGAKPSHPEEVGDIVVLMTRYSTHNGGGHTVTPTRCVNLMLEDITVYSSACMAFVEYECENTTYLRCCVDRCPPSRDYVHRADARIHSLTADAFHIDMALKGPRLIDCTAKFMGDDAINIHGQYYHVLGSEGHVLTSEMPWNIKPGDPVELVTRDGVRLPGAVVMDIQASGHLTDEEKRELRFEQKHNIQKARVTLDRDVEMPFRSLISSTKRVGNGFLIQGCDFGFNRSRGILVKASDGQIIGNRLTSCWMEAIKVSPETWCNESGCSDNIVIRDNIINDCGIGIAVYAHGPTNSIMESGAHRNISIISNRITNASFPNILVTSTDGLVINGNELKQPRAAKDCSEWWSWHVGFWKLNQDNLVPVMLQKCINVTSDVP